MQRGIMDGWIFVRPHTHTLFRNIIIKQQQQQRPQKDHPICDDEQKLQENVCFGFVRLH